MIIGDDHLIPLRDVPRLPWLPRRRRGARIHVSTLVRWAIQGRRGIRLETVLVGGQRCTTIEALRRFIVTLSERPEPAPTPAPLAVATARAKKAEQQLKDLGL